jgi:hypothetical protein
LEGRLIRLADQREFALVTYSRFPLNFLVELGKRDAK